MMIGREQQLQQLEERYNSGVFEMIPVFGRRRVGKTTLLKEFIKGHNGVYFSATKTPIQMNASKLASKILGTSAPLDMSLEDVLKEVAERSKDERYILIIDEYPKMLKRSPEVSDILQNFIDDIHEDSKLFLILCGSSVSMMKHEVMGYSSPIYGRRTGSLELLPLDLWDSMELLKGFGKDDALRIYGMVGGIPLYLKMFDPKESLKDNIARLFFQDMSFFRNEHEFVLLEEFDTPYTYYGILEAIATGHTALSEIASYSSLNEATAHKHLSSLISTGLVSRRAPVDNPNGRKARYVIDDNFMRFQFNRILPNAEYYDEKVLESVMTGLDTDMGRIFERICAEHLARLHHGEIGTWWGTDQDSRTQEEIDIVLTKRHDGIREGWFAECKYTKDPVGPDVLAKLKHRAGLVKGYDRTHLVIYSKNGFKGDLGDEAELYDLDSILGMKDPE